MTTGKWLLGALAALAAGPAFATAEILVGAPTFNHFAVWDTQGGIPPSGTVTLFADQFSLDSDQYVSKISMDVFGADDAPSIYAFELVQHLDDVGGLYGFLAASPPQIGATVDLDINAVLPAGNYFLRLTTGGFLGWLQSTNDYVTTAGSVDGFWTTQEGGIWRFGGAVADGGYQPGVFAVYGFDDGAGGGSAAPEPAGWALMIAGLGLAGSALRRRPKVQTAPLP